MPNPARALAFGMAKVLHLFVHPHPRASRANARLWQVAGQVAGITSVDLYARYPRFDIDPAREQAALAEHDVLVLQFPVHWYAAPALLKEWTDTVLTEGWAYGEGGRALAGKTLALAVTTGSPAHAYRPEGAQGHALTTFLSPYRQMAALCAMHWIPPYVLHHAGHADLAPHEQGFARLLTGLRDETLDRAALARHATLDAALIAESTPAP